MSPGSKLTLVVLVVDAILLAAVALLFLPLWIGPVPFPVTVVLAAVSTPWLVRSAAALDGSPAVAAVPLMTWVAAVLVLGAGGPGGNAMLPADWRSLLLLAAGILPGAMALGRVLAREMRHQSGPPRPRTEVS